MNYFKKGISIIRSHGLAELYSRLNLKMQVTILGIVEKWINALMNHRHIRDLDTIVAINKNKTVIVFPPLLDWNIPLFQRPQHIALNLSRLNYLYFFCSKNSLDRVYGFKRIDNNCYLTNRPDLLRNLKGDIIYHFYTTDLKLTKNKITDLLNAGRFILYEYIDEMHEDIGGAIPETAREAFMTVMANEACMVVSTADKLFREVVRYRSKNHLLVTNGVNYEHFHSRILRNLVPEKLKHIVTQGKIIIGYFGALAPWFDLDLVVKLANQRPDYHIVLIGVVYDNDPKWRRINQKNITITGQINYINLPEYASWFDVCMIPFLINEITESTSPIKLFEYMALGKPIVTTAIPESRKYRSVLIGENHADFIVKIDKAIALREDKDYLELVDQEARGNTWEMKAMQIDALIRQNLTRSRDNSN